jgi:hypothetical protein
MLFSDIFWVKQFLSFSDREYRKCRIYVSRQGVAGFRTSPSGLVVLPHDASVGVPARESKDLAPWRSPGGVRWPSRTEERYVSTGTTGP